MNYVFKGRAEVKTNEASGFIIELEGFEGPLHLLLDLCRAHKVDLRTISLVELADQYLKFINRAKKLKIELAADYLIMASWLVYLKSEKLIPEETANDENSAGKFTSDLKFQLLKLDAMRNAGVTLITGDQLNRDFFVRGYQEVQCNNKEVRLKASLIDLLRAYARLKTKGDFEPLHQKRVEVLTPEAAILHIKQKLKKLIGWHVLEEFSLRSWKKTAQRRRSSTATNFAALLELARLGEVEIAQQEVFAPIYIKSAMD